MVLFGTLTGYAVPLAVNETVASVTLTVAVPEPSPATRAALLNQTVSPAGIDEPLKSAVIAETVGVQRSSSGSRPRRALRAGRERSVPGMSAFLVWIGPGGQRRGVRTASGGEGRRPGCEWFAGAEGGRLWWDR